jgi:hypothetical protein
MSSFQRLNISRVGPAARPVLRQRPGATITTAAAVPAEPAAPASLPLPIYAKPTRKDLAVVIPFFNPTKSMRIIQNILFVTNLLSTTGIPYFVVEAATGSTPFTFTEAPNVFQYRTASYMFYKENLIVAAEKRIPAEFTKLLLLDSDILFDAPNWYDQISAILDSKQVIQPFSEAIWLGPDFVPGQRKHNMFQPEKGETHPGFAWAFRRDWYSRVGFFEYAIIGGGDIMFYFRLKSGNFSRHRCYKEDFDALAPIPPPSVGFVNFNVYHLFHGPLKSRQYLSREEVLWTFLQSKGLTRVSALVERREDGIFEWMPRYRDEVNALMLTYFKGRHDDGIS